MGDKSPKSTNKHAKQKQEKAADAKKKKRAADDAKRVIPGKK